MTYDGKLLARAREELERQRDKNREEETRRLERVYGRVPEIRQIDIQLRGHMAQLVKLTLSHAPKLTERIEELKKENLALQARRAELLVAHGWPLEYLDPIVSCPQCNDTGLLDGRPCVCVQRLYNRELTRELATLLRHGDESFENFNLNLYSDKLDPVYHQAPRETMKVNLAICHRFVEAFPNTSANLLLQGGTGLGKTYLSACIARAVAAKGCSVSYDSAAAAFEAFERQKFSREPEEAEAADRRVKRMLSCDLMILDDLGTEMPGPVSLSALYTLLNSRLIAGKNIIISTNCTDAELEKRYTPQICSRLAGEFQVLPFHGRDIRRMQR